MSSVFLNRGNTDVTDVQIEQAGSSSAEILTEQPLLDSTKDYVMGVTSCVCPLSEEPMITYDITASQLFEVRRRKFGGRFNTVDDSLDADLGAAGPQYCQLESGFKIYSVTDLVTFLASWSTRLSNAIADKGLSLDGAGDTLNVNVAIDANDPAIDRRANNYGGTRLLGVSLTPGGTAQLVGSSVFWNNFYVVTNAYCREILGFSGETLSVSKTADQLNTDEANLLQTDVDPVLIRDPAQELDPALPAQINGASYSIFRKTEERMLISVEVALSIPMNISIVNGTETRTHTVATFPLESKVVSTVTAGNGTLHDKTDLSIDTHMGRVHLLKKTNGNVQWYPLTSSFAIQNSRVEIFMTRRRYSTITNKWYTDRKPFKIHDDGVWSASLKFVSVF